MNTAGGYHINPFPCALLVWLWGCINKGLNVGRISLLLRACTLMALPWHSAYPCTIHLPYCCVCVPLPRTVGWLTALKLWSGPRYVLPLV